MNEFNNIKRACEQGDLETVIYMCHRCNDADINSLVHYYPLFYEKYTIFAYLGLNSTLSYVIQNAFRWAVRHCNLSVIKWFVTNYPIDVDVNDPNLLADASHYGNLQVVKYLIEERNINIHVYGDIALTNATIGGHLPVVKYLVEHGANSYARNSRALGFAVRYRHQDVVDYLVKQRSCGQNIIEWFASWIRQ